MKQVLLIGLVVVLTIGAMAAGAGIYKWTMVDANPPVATPTPAPAPGTRQPPSTQTDTIRSSEASNYVGTLATVCGPVVNTKYATTSKGQPTFLNFDKPYPNHTFVVLIWAATDVIFPTASSGITRVRTYVPLA